MWLLLALVLSSLMMLVTSLSSFGIFVVVVEVDIAVDGGGVDEDHFVVVICYCCNKFFTIFPLTKT